MTIRKQGERVGLIRVPVSIKVVGESDATYHAEFLVDTCATDSMAPASELRRVGIKPVGKLAYELANGRLVEYAFGLAQIEFLGDITAGRVIFGPEDAEPLLGVTQLESAGIVIDPRTGNLKRLPAIPLKQFVSVRASAVPRRSASGCRRPADDGPCAPR
jgi:predicted aspartyl protease